MQGVEARGLPPGLDRVVAGRGEVFVRAEGWTSRHVEHLEFLDETTARRRVTVDLRLPEGLRPIQWSSLDVFLVPVAMIAKADPVTRIDLRNEDGAALPLLTRAENAAVSSCALLDAAQTMLDGELDPELAARLRTVPAAAPKDASAARKKRPESARAINQTRVLATHAAGPQFARFLARLEDNSALWVPLDPSVGPARIVKLSYELALKRNPQPDRALLRLEQPYVPDAGSYHFQVLSPPGLQIRSMRLAAQRAVERLNEEVTTFVERTARGGHLYLDGLRLERTSQLQITFGAVRDGFLSSTVAVSGLITALLAAFAFVATPPVSLRDATVTLLLFVPALLVAFAVRAEHALAKRLLRGPRLLVFLSGAAAVAAAAAFALSSPMSDNPHNWCEGLFYGAAAATAVLGGLWLRAGRTVRRVVQRRGVLVSYATGDVISPLKPHDESPIGGTP